MTRILSDEVRPSIDENQVDAFFEERARKFSQLGPLRTVIYQDKNPELALQRDMAEKKRLLPLLQLNGTQRLLDLGCGVGRWVPSLQPSCGAYVGVDASPGLIEHARQSYLQMINVRFEVMRSDNLSLPDLTEAPFDRVLCAGLMIYLNDHSVLETLRRIGSACADDAIVLLREPVGVSHRLTLSEHYSEDMSQEYHAIYRTERELLDALGQTLLGEGFVLKDAGDVYDDQALNNRIETRQRWMVLQRGRE